ncbi:amino acid adenylation domain-containing protein [Streptomyces sp. LP05-1]|uniref:Amino acid adenylation domain-containing protein n=1 Tax=Streptomyces pyxinae TaxID=2970734 RepID=A0ABT2CA31_9ACTN|nr:amino acid adenylation domain-containing protein [Streptomyces sp. LP05-1]MCS0634269.1 amino acid adenylation domain-containing protein [Streptomyces sp. LP05-1]
MLPLSSSQEIVWLHEQVQPGSRAYNFTAVLDLWGSLDPEALRRGLAATLDRHPGLRLELVAVPGAVPGQRVAPACPPRLRTVDLGGEADPEAAFQELLRTEAETPLDTHEAPLLRWTLVRLADDRHRLIHVEHHLIHDGHSFAILLRDVFTVYRAHVLGEPVALPPAPSYADHVRAQAAERAARRARETGGTGETRQTGEADESLEFWTEELREVSYDLPLPGLTRPGTRRRHHGGQLRQSIGADLAERLRAHARTRGLTPFATLLGLFAELLRRHSGRSRMVVGTAVGNRPRGFEDAVGMFVNTIPLALRLDPAAPAEEMTDEVTDTLIRALPHQEIPVQELTRALGLHTSGADNPLFGVMFSAHDAELPEIDVPGLDVTLFEGFNTGTTRFDLDVVLLPDDRRGVSPRHGAAGMTLVWDYDADLFGADVVTLLAERFAGLLRAYLADPSAALADLAPPPVPPAPAPVPAPAPAPVPVPESESESVPSGLVPVSSGPVPAGAAGGDPLDAGAAAPAGRDLLDPVAAQDPARPALLAGDRCLSYGELDALVASLAGRLREAGVTAGQPVAVVLPRGADAVVALLACLRTGAVYCPLSPSDPPARLELLLSRLAPALVLTAPGAPVPVPDGLPTAQVGSALTPADGSPFPRARAAATVPGAAYLIHTSGSTGTPKPVAVGRAALENHLTGVADRFGLVPGDRALLFAQPSFDVSLEEVLPSLHAGACLVVPAYEVPTGAELAELLAAARVTVANLPTSYFLAVRKELAGALEAGHWTPRLLALGGERLPAEVMRAFRAGTDARLLNVYGVTEAAISTTVHEITAESLLPVSPEGPVSPDDSDGALAAEIPLGTELPGETVHVLDAHLRPLPDGAVGELAISGAGLAEGYPGNPEATAARFVSVEALGGRRAYLTGDLGYRGLDGRLYFLGRRDHQVKLRGHRIELEEVEAAASAALGGRSCAVVLDREAPGGPRLVGFLEAAGSDADWDEQALYAELSRRLPGALVPARWTLLATMPTLAGGKPNRAELTRAAAALDRDEPGTEAAGGGLSGTAGSDAEAAGSEAAGAGAKAAGLEREAGRAEFGTAGYGSGALPGEPDAPDAPVALDGPVAASAGDDPMTALLADGWRAVLGHGRFDATSHFFRTGGHSLLAAQLAAWLEPHLGQRPPLRLIFQHPVLADQADALAATATTVTAATSTRTES